MKITLTNKDVCKILATLSVEDIRDRLELDYNWSVWKIPNYIGESVELELEAQGELI